MSQMDLSELLSQVVLLQKYRSERQQFFPSAGSLDWFVRQHKAELIEAGALLLMRGAWHVDAQRFDKAVRSIGEREAKTWLAREVPAPARQSA